MEYIFLPSYRLDRHSKPVQNKNYKKQFPPSSYLHELLNELIDCADGQDSSRTNGEYC